MASTLPPGDPFALAMAEQPRLKELYLDAEVDGGYVRDQSVFAPGISISDDMSVLVRYSSGVTMTYRSQPTSILMFEWISTDCTEMKMR